MKPLLCVDCPLLWFTVLLNYHGNNSPKNSNEIKVIAQSCQAVQGRGMQADVPLFLWYVERAQGVFWYKLGLGRFEVCLCCALPALKSGSWTLSAGHFLFLCCLVALPVWSPWTGAGLPLITYRLVWTPPMCVCKYGPNLAVLMLEKAMQRVWIGQDCVCQAKQSEKLYCDTDLFWQSRDSVVPPWPPQHSYF